MQNVDLIPNYFSSGEEDSPGIIGGGGNQNYLVKGVRGHPYQVRAHGTYGHRGNLRLGGGQYSDERVYYKERGARKRNQYYMVRQGGPSETIPDHFATDGVRQRNRFYQYESHDDPFDQAQLEYLSRQGTNFVNSQIIVDEYGDEVYVPQNQGFFSDSKGQYYKGGAVYKKKHKRSRKHREGRRHRQSRKKYSSEESPYGREIDDDLNAREQIHSNYRGTPALSESSASSESDYSSGSSSSDGSSASKKLKAKERKAKKMLKQATLAKK